MRRVLPAFLTAALLLAVHPGFATSPALAHGGSYRGPAGEIPPNSREPHDPPPPTDPTPPTTPGGDGEGPTTGGGDGIPPTTGGGDGDPPSSGGGDGQGPTPPGGQGPVGPTTGPGARRGGGKKAPGFEEWIYWWNFNKDDILALKARMARLRSVSGSGAHRFGRRTAAGSAPIVPPARSRITQHVMPALRDLLAQDDLNFDIRSAAALALAKIGDQSIVESLQEMTLGQRTGRGRYHPVVRESAALSFGLLQRNTADVRQFLIEVIGDEELSGSFVRPFAAISLGLVAGDGDPDAAATQALLQALERKERRGGVKPACLVALGLIGDPETVPALCEMLETGRAGASPDGELDDTELSFVVQALGRIGAVGYDAPGREEAVLNALADRLLPRRNRDVPVNVARSAAIALGQLGQGADAPTQARVFEVLRKAVNRDKVESSTHTFATMSIGRLAASRGCDPAVRRKATATLRHLLEKPRRRNLTAPYAGLALGLVARALVDEGAPAPEEDIRKPLREKLEKTRSPLPRGAYAVALGLAGDPLAVPALLEVLRDDGADGRLRGHAAIALGMIGDHSARRAISEALATETDRELRIQTAVAAGLMGDASVVGPLVEILEDGGETQYVLGSVALALGQIGDERAVDPLLVICLDEANERPALTRALATVALGQIGDQAPVPTLSRVARDLNYRAPVKALIELLTIL